MYWLSIKTFAIVFALQSNVVLRDKYVDIPRTISIKGAFLGTNPYKSASVSFVEGLVHRMLSVLLPDSPRELDH